MNKPQTTDEKYTMLATGYLSLPLELRQKILHHALEDATDQDRALNTNIKLLEIVVYPWCYTRGTNCPSAPHLYRISSNITRVHPTIADDIQFVLEQNLKVLEEERARYFEWSYAAHMIVLNGQITEFYEPASAWLTIDHRKKLRRWLRLGAPLVSRGYGARRGGEERRAGFRATMRSAINI